MPVRMEPKLNKHFFPFLFTINDILLYRKITQSTYHTSKSQIRTVHYYGMALFLNCRLLLLLFVFSRYSRILRILRRRWGLSLSHSWQECSFSVIFYKVQYGKNYQTISVALFPILVPTLITLILLQSTLQPRNHRNFLFKKNRVPLHVKNIRVN